MSSTYSPVLSAMKAAFLEAGLIPNQFWLMIGQFIAWNTLAEEFDLPYRCPTSSEDGCVSGSELRRRQDVLASLESLGLLRYGFEPLDDIYYQRLSEHLIVRLGQIARTATQLQNYDDVIALAMAWADRWFSDVNRNDGGLPSEVADFAVSALKEDGIDWVHCQGANVESVAVACMQRGMHPLVESLSTPIAVAIYAAILGNRFEFVRRDPLCGLDLPNELPSVQALIACPPWGLNQEPYKQVLMRPSKFNIRSSAGRGLEIAVESKATKLAVFVPPSVLFTSGAEKELRKHLIANGALSTIVSFPGGLLKDTNIPFAMLTFDRDRKDRSSFVFCKVDPELHVSGAGKKRSRDRRFDGESDVLELIKSPDSVRSIRVHSSVVESNDYLLTPERYLTKSIDQEIGDSRKLLPLEDLVTIIKPQFLRSSEADDAVQIEEVLPAELPEYGFLESAPRTRKVEPAGLETFSRQILGAYDVLLSTKGTIGKVGIVDPRRVADIKLLPSQASVILRLKQGSPIVDGRYLVMYLRSPLVQRSLAAMGTGVTMPNIALGDLKSLRIWVPDVEMQQRFVRAFNRQADLQLEIGLLRREQCEVADDLWEETALAVATPQ